MRFLGVQNLVAKTLVFTLIIYFYARAENITSAIEEDGDVDDVTSYIETLQKNQRTLLGKMIQFIDSTTEKFTQFDQRFSNLERMGMDRHEKLKNEIASDRLATLQISPEKFFKHSTTCGGILEVARGLPSTIRYPNDGGNYRNWERCTWLVKPQANFASYYIKVESVSMETGYDGVRVYFWEWNGDELHSQKITKFGSWISIPAPYVLITFCSDLSNVGGGFSASIIGIGTSSDSLTYKPYWFTNPFQNFSYTQDNNNNSSRGITNNELVAVAVGPQFHENVTAVVSLVHTEIDTIKLYALACHHDHNDPAHLSIGSVPGKNFSGSFISPTFPFLVIFKSKERISRKRMTVSLFKIPN